MAGIERAVADRGDISSAVSRCSLTMMPEATEARFRGKFDIGQHADADHDESAGYAGRR
jgi:hypothetical protein